MFGSVDLWDPKLDYIKFGEDKEIEVGGRKYVWDETMLAYKSTTDEPLKISDFHNACWSSPWFIMGEYVGSYTYIPMYIGLIGSEGMHRASKLADTDRSKYSLSR